MSVLGYNRNESKKEAFRMSQNVKVSIEYCTM
ncbi:hypothetical protein EDD64_1177 [Effusibacillus lacus]|nr:hypothetical protein EDD64_1177 [Effusibacillus lacus]